MSGDMVSLAAVLAIIEAMPDGLSKWRRRLTEGIEALHALTPQPNAGHDALIRDIEVEVVNSEMCPGLAGRIIIALRSLPPRPACPGGGKLIPDTPPPAWADGEGGDA